MLNYQRVTPYNHHSTGFFWTLCNTAHISSQHSHGQSGQTHAHLMSEFWSFVPPISAWTGCPGTEILLMMMAASSFFVHEDLSTQPVCPSFLNYPQLSHTFICFSKFFTSVAWVNMVETCWNICGFMIASKHKGRVVWSTPTTVAHIMTWKTQSSAPDILISFASWFLRTLRSHVATKMIPLLDPDFVHHATGFKHKKGTCL